MRRRASIVLVVAGLALSGCAGTADATTTVTPTPWPPQTVAESPSVEPTLSDAEAAALVAATYRDFLDTASAVIAAGGDPEGKLDDLVTDNMAGPVQATIDFAESGDWEASGSAATHDEKLLDRTVVNGLPALRASFCVDASQLVITDSSGQPIRRDNEATGGAVIATVVLDNNKPRLHATEPNESSGSC